MLSLETDVLVQLGLAILLGGMIGFERESHGRAAGLRTMVLVCLGSTLIMVVSERIPATFHGPGDQAVVRIDPGRIAAGVVTGIGFLGAGVIIKLGDVIRGVTTSATIWFVAALGIVIGRKEYALAVLATLTALAVLWLFQFPERSLKNTIYRIVTLEADSDRAAVLEDARRVLEQEGMRLMDLKVGITKNVSTIHLHVRATQALQGYEFVRRLSQIEGVHRAAWD